MFSPSAKTKSPRKKGGISKASGVKTKKDKKGILKKQKGKMKPSDTENRNVASKKDARDQICRRSRDDAPEEPRQLFLNLQAAADLIDLIENTGQSQVRHGFPRGPPLD